MPLSMEGRVCPFARHRWLAFRDRPSTISERESTMTTHGPPSNRNVYCIAQVDSGGTFSIGQMNSGCGSVSPDRLSAGQHSANIADGH